MQSTLHSKKKKKRNNFKTNKNPKYNLKKNNVKS